MSTYKTDYLNWMQNNFSSDSDFCLPENVDDCIKYISQEFSALGYPSIYTEENTCDLSKHCDVVQLLNVTYELLGKQREYEQAKEDIECRNRGLLEDLKAVSRKNSCLKESLELTDRKYKSALEKERQSSEKNKELSQLLKTEKDESKRLTFQLQQQKKTYQHEIRKYENTTSQMKSRINQMLTDKSQNKNIATITSSNSLPKASNQRGKWKTGSVAKSNLEEMYTSVISGYETRCQEMLKNITTLHSCLEFIQSQMFEIISQQKIEETSSNACSTPLQAILNGTNVQKCLEGRFNYLIEKVKENCVPRQMSNAKLVNGESSSLQSKVCLGEDFEQEGKILNKKAGSLNALNQRCEQCGLQSDLLSPKELEIEKEKLIKGKSELTETLAFIEKEKSELEACKLNVIKMALGQVDTSSQWHDNFNIVPSFSVIQTSGGLTAVPSENQLRNCLSSPNLINETLYPLWNSNALKGDLQPTITEPEGPAQNSPSSLETHVPTVNEDVNLPMWASRAMNNEYSSTSVQLDTEARDNFSNQDLNVSAASSLEEQNLVRLHSAMEDIENKRKQVSL